MVKNGATSITQDLKCFYRNKAEDGQQPEKSEEEGVGR